MGREEERIKSKLEKNPIEECNTIQKRFYPELINKFGAKKMLDIKVIQHTLRRLC